MTMTLNFALVDLVIKSVANGYLSACTQKGTHGKKYLTPSSESWKVSEYYKMLE